MYVYIKSEPNLYTVGHYAPVSPYINSKGERVEHSFISESDHGTSEAAAKRVNFLNGGGNVTVHREYQYHPDMCSEF